MEEALGWPKWPLPSLGLAVSGSTPYREVGPQGEAASGVWVAAAGHNLRCLQRRGEA